MLAVYRSLFVGLVAVLVLAAIVMAIRGMGILDELHRERTTGLRRLGTFPFLVTVYLWPFVLVGMPLAWVVGLVGWVPVCDWCIPTLIVWFALNVAAPFYIGLHEFAEMYRRNKPKPPSIG